MLTLQELQKQGFHPLAYRMFLLGGHYRAQLEFTMDGLAAAQATLRRLIRRTAALGRLPSVGTLEEARALASDDSAAVAVIDQLDQAISADLNTPRVLAVLQESLRDAVLSEHGQRVVTAASGAVLGLPFDRLEPADVEPAAEQFSQSDQATVDKLIAEREAARTARDWARADALRAELSELGVQLTDTPTGPVWSRITS